MLEMGTSSAIVKTYSITGSIIIAIVANRKGQ